MSCMGMLGFEDQNTTRDGIIVVSGTPGYTGDVPPSSNSVRCIAGNHSARKPWLQDDQVSLTEPSGTEYWFHYFYRTNINTASNDGLRLGLGRSGTPLISVSAEDFTNKLTIYIQGVGVVATATTEAFSLTVWKRIHVRVDQQAGGDIEVYTDGDLSTPVVSYTLTAPDIAALAGKPNEFYWTTKLSGLERVDDAFSIDPNTAPGVTDINLLIGASIEPHSPISDSGTHTDWTGDFTDIDELPASDSDFIQATAVGQISQFGFGALVDERVYCVRMMARMTRVGTTAGANVRTSLRLSAVDYTGADTPAPGDGDNEWLFQQAPDSTAWDKTKFDGTEFGLESRT